MNILHLVPGGSGDYVKDVYSDNRAQLRNMVALNAGLMLDGDEGKDFAYAETIFRKVVEGYGVKDIFMVAQVDDPLKYTGFLMARNGYIFQLYVLPEFRRQGYGDKLLGHYLEACKGSAEAFQANWFPNNTATSHLFIKHGFSITKGWSEYAGVEEVRAWKQGNINYHEDKIDNPVSGRGYIDFREDYAVVDGHYTLSELESLLIVAKRKLKKDA